MSVIVPNHVLSVERSVLAEFFLAFARFEFSLKASGFARNGKWGAEVNWNQFSDAVAPSFLPPTNAEVMHAVEYLSHTPPKRQIISNGSLQWESRAAPADWSEMRVLLFHVQGARNNLVHGAKFIERESEDWERDRKLLEAASCIIAECLRLWAMSRSLLNAAR